MSKTRSGHRVAAVAVALVAALVMLVATGALPAPASPRVDSGALLTWTALTPATSPPARVHPAMAFDAASGTTVLFGGRAGSQVLGDTWTWDGTTWTAQQPATAPPPLESASMAYDSTGHRLVLFGGIGSDGTASAATWAWTGSTWTQLTAAPSPPARYAAALAGDNATGTVVLFGGLSSPGVSLGDTWTWDGTNWTAQTPLTAPSARSGAAITFDAARGVVVLFGGMNGSVNQADTWTWDGTNWALLNPPTSPPARNDAAFAYDPGTQTAVLFGGSASAVMTVLRDSWLWNGTTWSTSLPLSVLPTLNPPARIGAGLAQSPVRLVLFAGQSGGPTPAALDDTWTVDTVVPLDPPTTTTVAPRPATTTTVAGATTVSPTTKGVAPTTAPTTKPRVFSPAPPAPPALAVTTRAVRQGDPVTVSGSGFLPGSRIVVTFQSSRVVVATVTADAAGRFRVTVVVPPNAEIGEHHIEATGPARSGAQAILVAQVSIARPPGHTSWLLPALMIALTILLAAGAGVVLTASARRPHRHAA